jgi:hypothetical protein
MHVYQQHVYMGAARVDVEPDAAFVALLLYNAADNVVLVDTRSIHVLDFAGKYRHKLDAASPVESSAITPDGQRLVICYQEQAMIRVYDADLRLLREGGARELWEQAAPVQLWADEPPPDAAFEAVSLANDGTLVFVWGDVLCCTHVSVLRSVPHTNMLF